MPDQEALKKKYHAGANGLCPTIAKWEEKRDAEFDAIKKDFRITRSEFDKLMDNFCLGIQQVYNEERFEATLRVVPRLFQKDSPDAPEVERQIFYQHDSKQIMISGSILQTFKTAMDTNRTIDTDHVKGAKPTEAALALGIEEASHAVYCQDPKNQAEVKKHTAREIPLEELFAPIFSSADHGHDIIFRAEEHAAAAVQRIMTDMMTKKIGPFTPEVLPRP